MAGYRSWLHCSLAIVLTSAIVPSGRSQTAAPPVIYTEPPTSTYYVPLAVPTCKVYSLSDFGDDPQLCKWIAETIPQMIQPGTWAGVDGKQKLSYFAPGKVMVINHAPTVHGQVDEFLQNLKKSLPQAKAVRRDPLLLPAQFTASDRPVGPTAPMVGYPVPNAPATPKHLFHFIIRYEGEGIIDANVVKFAKALNQEMPAGATNAGGVYVTPPTAPAPPPYNGPAGVPGVVPPAPVQPSSGTAPVPPMPPADPLPAPRSSTPSAPTRPGPLPPAVPILPSQPFFIW